MSTIVSPSSRLSAPRPASALVMRPVSSTSASTASCGLLVTSISLSLLTTTRSTASPRWNELGARSRYRPGPNAGSMRPTSK